MLFSKLRLKCFYLSFAIFHILLCANAQQKDNKPERVAWFQDLAFGMFIHWNVDVSLGGVISHSLAGASDDYVNRYIEELPHFFNPKEFNPDEWAMMAK